MRLTAALLVLLSVGASCSAASGPEGEWQVLTLGQSTLAVADGVTLTLSDGQASGRSGCNRFTGRYVTDGDSFAFGPLAATRMACPDRAMQIEAEFHALVSTITGWQRDGDTLILMQGTDPVFRAVPRILP